MTVPHLGLDVRDYSTNRRLAGMLLDALQVLVPRRDSGLPPLVARPDSSVRLLERRLFFPTRCSPTGMVTAANVDAGVYPLHLRAPNYLPFDGTVTSPLASALRVDLHRDVAYPFGAEDTLIRGSVLRSGGAPLLGFDVRLTDPVATVPHHRVPLNARGEFVIFVPEKRASSVVTLEVFHPAGSLSVTTPVIAVHRSTSIPLITVP